MGKERLQQDDMERYVESRFLQWKWSSNEQHKMELQYFGELGKVKQQQAKTSHQKGIIKAYYSDLIAGMKKERRYFRRQFEQEYLLTNPKGVTGVRYDKLKNQFLARVTYLQEQVDEDTRKLTLVKEDEEFEVSEDWILNESGLVDDVVEHIMDMDAEDGYFVIPKGKKYMNQESTQELDL